MNTTSSQSEDVLVADTEESYNHDSVAEAPLEIAHKQFDELCAQYYHSWFRYHPEDAVDVGVTDYADQLKSYEHDDIGALIALNQMMQSALDEINLSGLDEARQLDYRIIKGAISIELHDLEEK